MESVNVEKKTPKILSWVFVVFITFALIVSMYQVCDLKDQYNEQLTQINTLQGQIKELETKVEKQTKTIDKQNKTISELKPKANSYTKICAFLEYDKIGYASNNFKTDEGIIVVRKNEKKHKFKLTANWTNGGAVEVSYSSDAATVSFDKNNWYTSTTMTVNPHSVGVTVVTFSNSVNDDIFKILIIVTE